MSKLLKFTTSIVICFSAAGLGTLFTVPAIPSWFSTLNKPFFSPPNWLFGPAWTILYLLMAISLFLIWQEGVKEKKVKKALKLFAIQLALNAAWSPVFFGAKNLLLALLIIIVLWFFIIKTIFAFRKINKKAGYLLYPYIAWVSFATVLNFSIWFLNK